MFIVPRPGPGTSSVGAKCSLRCVWYDDHISLLRSWKIRCLSGCYKHFVPTGLPEHLLLIDYCTLLTAYRSLLTLFSDDTLHNPSKPSTS